MTRSDNLPPVEPALIVFGILPGETTTRAGWFPQEQVARAEYAARVFGLLTLRVASDHIRAIARPLERGELGSNEQLQLPPAPADIVSDLVLHHRAIRAAGLPRGPELGQGGAPRAKRSRSAIPRAFWDVLTLTDVVLAAHLENGEPAGWWEAVILDLRSSTYTLRWCDYPEEGLFQRHRKHVALLFPD